MNQKIFACSDIHGFYKELKTALSNKGFDINNPDHILLSLGDEFDRGSEARETLAFLQNLKVQNRLMLVRGNHTLLMWDLLNELFVYRKPQGSHHYSNGTVGTVAQLTGDSEITRKLNYWQDLTDTELEKINESMKPWRELVADAVNYYEIGKYIFVHGWIPFESYSPSAYDDCMVGYLEGWRDLPTFSPKWEQATWAGFPNAYKAKCFEPDKTIVCGHWHCSAYWGDIKRERKPFPEKNRKGWEKSFEPAITPEFIAIDACTAYSRIVNVLVFEKVSEDQLILLDEQNNTCYNNNNKKE